MKHYIFRSPACGAVRLGDVSVQRLAHLFDLSDSPLIVTDESGEEVDATSDEKMLAHLDERKNREVFTVINEWLLENSVHLCGREAFESDEQFQAAAIAEMNHNMRRRENFLQNLHEMRMAMYEMQHTSLLDVPLSDSLLSKQLSEAPEKLTETGLYKTNLFTEEFCHKLVEEIDAIEESGAPLVLPNSMNRYGVVLSDLGFATMFMWMYKEKLEPIFKRCFPDVRTDAVDSVHAFIVEYKMDEDRALDFHYDNSTLTVNVLLRTDFSGGSLYFRGILDEESTHDEDVEFRWQGTPAGTALLHRGTHRHGAKEITSGIRYNLILWYSISEQDSH